jgi:LPS O-antigen subunit length determinant protein (WzzB/FepE family)
MKKIIILLSLSLFSLEAQVSTYIKRKKHQMDCAIRNIRKKDVSDCSQDDISTGKKWLTGGAIAAGTVVAAGAGATIANQNIPLNDKTNTIAPQNNLQEQLELMNIIREVQGYLGQIQAGKSPTFPNNVETYVQQIKSKYGECSNQLQSLINNIKEKTQEALSSRIYIRIKNKENITDHDRAYAKKLGKELNTLYDLAMQIANNICLKDMGKQPGPTFGKATSGQN